MSYVKVKWIHSNPKYPVLIYSELDANRWEIRKIEIFQDGHASYADRQKSSGDTNLGKEPFPLLREIVIDPQFEPLEISGDEFDEVWLRRLS